MKRKPNGSPSRSAREEGLGNPDVKFATVGVEAIDEARPSEKLMGSAPELVGLCLRLVEHGPEFSSGSPVDLRPNIHY
jgi:hypothetical protein